MVVLSEVLCLLHKLDSFEKNLSTCLDIAGHHTDILVLNLYHDVLCELSLAFFRRYNNAKTTSEKIAMNGESFGFSSRTTEEVQLVIFVAIVCYSSP